jgi:NAD(P)-dependent dehydrogenase (short-subunit alcohol dehydrogenase family)
MRTHVITGAGSGIGRATAELLKQRGDRVIGVDLVGAEIVADLSTLAGVEQMVADVRGACAAAHAPLDGVVACAGVAVPTALTAKVNYYGAVRTMDLLRPLQEGSASPRTVAVASMASIMPLDDTLVDLLLDGSETDALALAAAMEKDERNQLLYSSGKRALARWIRRHAALPEWAGAGIPLNAVAPGIINTPMVADLIATAESRAAILERVPMPLNGIARADDVAELLAWLISVENNHLCGQVVFIDGGSDVVIRGDSTF